MQGDFERLDAGPDAAIAAADAGQARAEMAVQAEAYLRKRAEVLLLRWTIDRYRAEKQTPLLKRATDLFSWLTLGRYTQLLVDLEGEKARLSGQTRDQDVVPVEGMSEGPGTSSTWRSASPPSKTRSRPERGCRSSPTICS